MASRPAPPVRPARASLQDPLALRPSGVSSALTVEEARLSSAAIDTFVDVLGGRQALTDALAIATDHPEVEQVVSLLLDPRYDDLPLRRLCGLAGLTIADLFAAYRKAMIVRAHVQAYQAITTRLLPVVEDVMSRAAPYEVGCGGCGATGQITEPGEKGEPPTSEVCPTCAGRGRVLQLPDLDRQKLALELASLISRAAGVNVVQASQTTLTLAEAGAASGAGKGTLEAVQQAVSDLFSRTPVVIEVTPTTVEGTAAATEAASEASETSAVSHPPTAPPD